MKKIIILIAVCCISLSSWGQSKSIPGIIVSENGYPLKNIKLSVINSSSSAKTNKNGRFVLKKVQASDSIIVQVSNESYVKFLLGDNDSLKLVLSDNMISVNLGSLSGISFPVMLGTYYHDFAKNASVITAQMIERMNARTVLDVLTTHVPGIMYNGQGIIIRGAKSLMASNDAIFIIDGTYSDFGAANNIPVEIVETIEIVKDGAGYGTRGANGVILINTKR